MSSESPAPEWSKKLTLDPALFKPTPDESAFLKAQTGIQDDGKLKEHVLVVQEEAWKVFPYPCIRLFTFTKLGIKINPRYKDLLKMGQERPGAIYLDMGCCFGNDARKAIADGFPVENVVCSDLERGFWDLGHKLFKSTQETFPVPFIGGSIFDTNVIEPSAPFYAPPSTPRPDLKTLTSLNPLHGHVTAIHTASFFHLFNEAEQATAARALASLLSPESGSVIFGHHIGNKVAGPRTKANSRGQYPYDHSPESWKELWDGVVFEKGKVEVWCILHELTGSGIDTKSIFNDDMKISILIWSVKRL